MKYNWTIYPMGEPRPDDTRVYEETERRELEFAIACQVSGLLSHYAAIEEVDIEEWDASTGEAIEEADEEIYDTLSMDTFMIDDDFELYIGQLPIFRGENLTAPGAHSVQLLGENEEVHRMLTVWDPDVAMSPRVHDATGGDLDLKHLQELHEALTVCSRMAAQISLEDDITNENPHMAANFPVRTVLRQFEQLAAQLEPED